MKVFNLFFPENSLIFFWGKSIFRMIYLFEIDITAKLSENKFPLILKLMWNILSLIKKKKLWQLYFHV